MSQIQVLSSGGGGSGTVQYLAGNSGGNVGPAAGVINVVGGSGISIVGTPLTNTLTASLSPLTSPSFMASPTSSAAVTGDGTVYTLVATNIIWNNGGVFDGTSTFTAPVAGFYLFDYSIALNGILPAHTVMEVNLVTTAQTFRKMMSPENCCDGNGNLTVVNSIIARMSAGDTATITVAVYNGTKVVDIFNDVEDSRFSAYLLSEVLPQTPQVASAFSAYLDTPINNCTGDGTIVDPVVFNATFYDLHSDYNNATGVFTAPVKGVYSFSAACLTSGATTAYQAELLIQNSASLNAFHSRCDTDTANLPAGSVLYITRTIEMAMNLGDEAYVQYSVYGQGTKTLNIYGEGGKYWTTFSGHLIYQT